MYEQLLINHCAPTLAGMKTGNLFTCPFQAKADIYKETSRLNKMLVPKGMRILPLRYANQRALMYLYRPEHLKRDFANRHTSLLLKKYGYVCEHPDLCIVQLIKKLRSCSEFPHEIGLFLGYPPEDVQGFIENKARCSKCTGCWKVYGDEEKAKMLFCRYKKCTDVYCLQWSKGIGIEQLAVAV